MIIVQEIDKAIAELEKKEQTFSVVEKLAWLYIVRDHNSIDDSHALLMIDDKYEPSTQYVTEFGQYASKMSMDDLIHIMEEHMKAIQVLYPKEYNKIMMQMKDKT